MVGEQAWVVRGPIIIATLALTADNEPACRASRPVIWREQGYMVTARNGAVASPGRRSNQQRNKYSRNLCTVHR
jgi:hypothetical protein